MEEVDANAEAVKIAEEFIEGIPERLEGYGELLDVIKGILFEVLERMGIDPTDFLFWALVLLLIIITVGKKIVFTKWILVAVAMVVLLAWIL